MRPDVRVRRAGCSTTWTSTATASATPRDCDPGTPTQPFIDLKSGYVLRSIDKFPKQGLEAPWRLLPELRARHPDCSRYGAIEDGAMEFSNPAPV